MKLQAWIVDSLHRQFPLCKPSRTNTISLLAARGERVAFQACVRAEELWPVTVNAAVAASDDLNVRVRRVGCVPLAHHTANTPVDELDGVGHIPGFSPDVLWNDATALCPRGEAVSFWITINVPVDAKVGEHDIAVTLTVGEKESITLHATLDVSHVVLERRKNFRVTHWFYADALCDWYKVAPFGKAFWPICENYMRNYAEHGSDLIYVPVFTPPLDGVKRPTQLLGVTRIAKDKYEFDWTEVKRWIKLAKSVGLDHFEWTHLFTQWGCANAIRIYEGHGETEKLLWPATTGATSPTYRKFLSQFLPAMKTFLVREKLDKQSLFHISDEPHGDVHRQNYCAARAMMRELAPWMNVMDALSDIQYGREHLIDLPIASISTAIDFLNEGIDCWAYFCCDPRGRFVNRFIDTPLAKIRMTGSLLYRWPFSGFLHWGYNYWQKWQSRELIDPFTCSDAKQWPAWSNGDTFVVYPGADGPLDSIRWEVFADSLQDYALFQTVGLDRNDKRLAAMKSFEDFPKDGTWLTKLRRQLLKK